MLSRTYLPFLLAFLCLGSCVSQQKYKSLLQARDNLEIKATDYSIQLAQERTRAINLRNKNEDLNQQLVQTNLEKQRINREMEQLHKDGSALASSHQELSLKFEDMRDYFDIVLDECDKDKIQVSRKQRQLNQKEDSISTVISALQNTKFSLQEREQQIQAIESLASSKSVLVDSIYQDLNRSLSNLITAQFSISRSTDAVKISIDEPVLFETGSLTITDYGVQALEQLAIALNAQNDVQITIVGNTDRNRIAKKAKYLNDNWDLSVLKAAAVTRALAASKLDPRVITVAGRGEVNPMISNHTEEGREKNKRTEVIIKPGALEQVDFDNLQNTN